VLRALLVLLLAANALVFAWTSGWLAPTFQPPRHADREPARLAAQMHPERVVVLAPGAASTAVAAARAAVRACLETGPLAEADVPAAEAALVQAGLAPGSWVRGAPQAGQAAGVWLRATQMDGPTQARLRTLQDPALPAPFKPCDAAR
jgi:hypothetical protein